MQKGGVGVLACALLFVWSGFATAESHCETTEGNLLSFQDVFEQWRKTVLYCAIKEGMTVDEVAGLLRSEPCLMASCASTPMVRIVVAGLLRSGPYHMGGYRNLITWPLRIAVIQYYQSLDLTIHYTNHDPRGIIRVNKITFHDFTPGCRPLFW